MTGGKKIKVYAKVDDERGSNPHVIGLDESGCVYATRENVDISNAKDGILDIDFEKIESRHSMIVEFEEMSDSEVENFGMFVGYTYV